MTRMSVRLRNMAAAAMTLAALAGPAAADDFYKGKTINLYVGSGAGGGYDLFGRLVARHIGRHLPGQPIVVVHNMPGAGSITAANYVFNNAPRDGTVLEIGTPSIALVEALRTPGVRFEAAKLNWIGRVASLLNVTFTWNTSKVKTIEEATRTETLIASIANTSPLALYPKVMNSGAGTKFKVIKGYADSNATLLAVERGEADGSTVSWNMLYSGHRDWLRDKKINILVQYTAQRSAQMPDIPAAVDLARTPTKAASSRCSSNGADVGYAIASTPETPADRVKMLRDAFR